MCRRSVGSRLLGGRSGEMLWGSLVRPPQGGRVVEGVLVVGSARLGSVGAF